MTKEILLVLKEEIDEVKEGLSNGGLLNFDDDHHVVREVSKLTGYIDGLNFIVSLIEQTKEEEIEDEI